MKKNQSSKGAKGKPTAPKKSEKKKKVNSIIPIDPGKDLAVPDNIVTDKMIDDFLFGSETKLTPEHKVLFKKTALSFQLNPLKREIYAIPFKDKNGNIRMNIVVGYEVYLKRAERSGKLDGWKVWTEGKKGTDLKACLEIKRKDFSDVFYHEVYFSEYDQGRNLWASKPLTMIKKVAMAQGFRLAFPDDLGGMPYTSDELPSQSNDEPKNITPDPASISWGETEIKLFERLKSQCQILNINGIDLRDKLKIKRFEDLKHDQLKKIVDDLDKQINDMTDKELKKEEKK